MTYPTAYTPIFVLYVDDEEFLHEPTKLFLEKFQDIILDTVKSGPEALDLLEKKRYDAIVADYSMAGMDGIELLKRIRSSGNRIPFIIFTGRGREEVVIDALNSGADFYLQKGRDVKAQYTELHAKICQAVRQRRIEEELRLSEERLRLSLMATNQGLWDVDIKTGNISANEEYYHLFGYEPGEVDVSYDWWLSTVHPDDRSLMKQAYHDYLTGKNEAYSIEYRFRTKQGSWKWILSRGKIISYDGTGKPVRMIGTHIDISDQKNLIEQLQTSEKRFRLVLETLPIGLWLADEKGQLLFGNPAGQKIWAAHPQVGQDEYGIFKGWKLPDHEEIKPDEWALGYAVNEGKTTSEELLEIEAFDGSHKIIKNWAVPIRDSHDTIVGAFVINQDVTEERLATEALKKSEERFHLTMTAVNEGLWDWNIAKGKVYFSPQYYRMIGYEPNEFTAQYSSWEENIHPDDRKDTIHALNDAIAHKENGFHIRFRFRCKDGSYIWILGRGQVIERDLEGNPIRIVGTHTDITKQVAAEQKLIEKHEELLKSYEQLAQSEEELRQSEKERAMALEQVQKNFAEMSILNDGIRNPLTVIAAQVEIYCPKIADIVTIQIKEIDDLITQLDRRWIQSEKVINYIRKHHGIEYQ